MITAAKPTPNEVAQQLMGRNYLSYSSVSLYQSCPLRGHFKYVQGLPEETVSASLVFGGAIHRVVELWLRELLAGNQAPDLDMLLAEYQEAWKERDLGSVEFGKGDDVSSLGRLAERMLRAFQASDFAQPTGTILGVEEEFRGELVPGCPDLLARVDLLIDTGSELVVTDLKTSRSRWSRDQADDASEQLLLYSELVKRLAPEKSVRVEFAVITKTKEPVVDRHSMSVDPRRVERTKRIVERVWRAIEAEHFYPSPLSDAVSVVPVPRPVPGLARLIAQFRTAPLISGDPMGTRSKLNVSAVNGCLILAAIIGVLFQSWTVFFVVAAILIAGDLYIGTIRPSGQRRVPLD